MAEPDAVSLDAALYAREQRDYTRAIQLFKVLLGRTPDDATLLRLLGTTYAYDRQYDLGIDVLERAMALSPRDIDIQLALARVYLWSGRIRAAAGIANTAAQAAPGSPEIAEIQVAIQAARTQSELRRGRVTVSVSQGVARVRVRGKVRNWYDTGAAISVWIHPQTAITAEAIREDRAGTADTNAAIRINRRFGKRSSVYMALSGTPDATFREQVGVKLGGELAVASLLALTIDGRHSRYAGKIEVTSATLGVRLHDAADRHSIALKTIAAWNEGDGQKLGWAMRASSQVHSDVRVFVGGATYPDTEAGITRRFEALYGGLVYEVSDRVRLRGSLAWERRRKSYTRESANIGLSVSF